MHTNCLLLWNLVSLSFKVSRSVFLCLFGYVSWYEVVNSFTLELLLCTRMCTREVTCKSACKNSLIADIAAFEQIAFRP